MNKTTHGKSGTLIYGVWCSMRSRCMNPNLPAYKNYGGRGIGLSESWKDFSNFYADMGDAAPGMTIDRKDNDLGYSKENCRWATKTEQSRNRRNIRILQVDGIEKPIFEWAEIYEINPRTIVSRLRAGWGVKSAVTTPVTVWPSGRGGPKPPQEQTEEDAETEEDKIDPRQLPIPGAAQTTEG